MMPSGKNKNDRIDSEKLAHLLRSNLIPPSYVYPADKRPVRALLRQRMDYVWRRSQKPLAFAVLIATAMVLMGGFQGQPFLLNDTSHARDHLYQ